MHKIEPDILTTVMIKNNFNGTIEKLVASDDVFSFSQNKHKHTGNSFYIMY